MSDFYTLLLTMIFGVGALLGAVIFLRSPRKSPMAYDAIYAAMDEAAVVLDAQHRVVSANPAAERLFGQSGAQLNQQIITNLLPTTPGQVFPPPSGADGRFDCVVHGDKICRAQLIPLGRNRVKLGYLLVLRDVTAHRQAEARLRASEARATALLAAVPDMMFRFDRDGTLLGYKATENQLFGLDIHVNQPPEATFAPDFIDLIKNAITETLAIGSAVEWVFDYDMPLGGLHHYEARIVPNGTDEVVIFVQDLTKSKRDERAAAELARSRERTQALARFVQHASHEFRTPVTIIKTTAYLLSRHNDPDKAARQLEQLDSQTQRLTDLIDSLSTPLTEVARS